MGIGFWEDPPTAPTLVIAGLVCLFNVIPTILAFVSAVRYRYQSSGIPFSRRNAWHWFFAQFASGLLGIALDLYSWLTVQIRWTGAVRRVTEEPLTSAELADASNEIFQVHFFALLLCLVPLLGAALRAIVLYRGERARSSGDELAGRR